MKKKFLVFFLLVGSSFAVVNENLKQEIGLSICNELITVNPCERQVDNQYSILYQIYEHNDGICWANSPALLNKEIVLTNNEQCLNTEKEMKSLVTRDHYVNDL